jgi:hypothetical protein
MSAVLEGLRLTGREEKARDIAQRWNALLVTLKAEDTAEYRRCFPGRLLRRIAEITKTGVEEIGCLSANESTMPSVGGSMMPGIASGRIPGGLWNGRKRL